MKVVPQISQSQTGQAVLTTPALASHRCSLAGNGSLLHPKNIVSLAPAMLIRLPAAPVFRRLQFLSSLGSMSTRQTGGIRGQTEEQAAKPRRPQIVFAPLHTFFASDQNNALGRHLTSFERLQHGALSFDNAAIKGQPPVLPRKESSPSLTKLLSGRTGLVLGSRFEDVEAVLVEATLEYSRSLVHVVNAAVASVLSHQRGVEDEQHRLSLSSNQSGQSLRIGHGHGPSSRSRAP